MRPRTSVNPLIVHVPETDAAERLAILSPTARALADAFWPGPLTLVLPLRPGAPVADLVTAGLPSLAIRVPAHPVARSLLNAAGLPLAAPSANPSGRISPTSADHVMQGLSGRIAGVLDAGECAVGLESTIIGLSDETPSLLRPGGLPTEAIEEALGRRLAKPADAAEISAPGQLASHYAPGVALVLDAKPDRVQNPDALWLAFGPIGDRKGLSLSPSGDLREAAANLFAYLHDLDDLGRKTGQSVVHVDPIPMTGLGLAINDRLTRAAAPRPSHSS